MINRHIIEKTTWDISFGCEDEAFEQQATLSAFAGNRMLAAIDEVFTEMSTPGQVLRIDHLEIDLGAVAYRDFRQDLDRRLRERLREALQEKLQSLKAAPAPTEGIIAGPLAELAQIEYFLANGHLPWNAIAADGHGFDQMIRRVIRLNGAQLVQFLQNTAHRASVVARLVRQVRIPVLHDIVRLLVPAAAGALIGLIADMQKIGGQTGPLQLSQRDWTDLLWQELLLDLLRMPPSLVTPRLAIARILEKISHRRNESHERMLALLVGAALDHKKRAGLNPALTAVLQRLLKSARSKRQPLPAPAEPGSAPETGARPPSDSRAAGKARRPAEPVESSPAAVLLERLAAALTQGRADGIENDWHTLLRQQPKQLEQTIRYYGRLADIRKKIAAGFPANMLRDVVRLLEPAAAGFIEEIVDRPQLFRKAGRKPAQEPERIERRLWEFTLTYLLAERGSRFNRKAYIGSLLRQMAAHENIEFQEMLRSLAGVLEQVSVPNALKTDLLQLLGELAKESGGTLPMDGNPNSRPKPLPRASVSIATYRRRLQKGAFPEIFNEDDLPLVASRLTREHTARLLNAMRRRQGPGFSATADDQQLLDKIIAAIRQARVKAGLPGHRPAPVATRADTVAGKPEGEALKPSSPGNIGVAAKEPSTPRADFLRARLAAAIHRGSTRIIKHVWPTLLREHPNLLQKALKHYGRLPGLRRRMAEGFSETMLRDIIHLLEPTDSGFMEEIVSRPQLLRPARAELPQKSGSLKRRVWEFTLTYLLAERGGRFNRKAYLGFLVRQMAAHDNVRDRDLLTAIIRMLQATKGSDALKNELLQLLVELAEEMDGRRPGSKKSVSPTRHVIRSIRLFEDLRYYGFAETFSAPGAAGDPAQIIAELARFYPWQVLRLYRDLQDGRLSLDTAVARLPVAALHRLLEAFFHIVRPDGRNRSDDFMRAVGTFGRRTRNQRHYYRQILQRVLSNRIVDFDKILDEIRSTPEPAGPAETDPLPAAAPEAQKPPVAPVQETVPPADRALERLSAYLKGNLKIDDAAGTRLNHLVERLITQQPEGLRRLLTDVLGRGEAAARLIDLLPERLLCRLLHLTRRAEHQRVQQAADTVVDAACFEASGITGDRLHRLKWRFILQFLFQERRSFDESVFVRRLAADLAAQSRLTDAAAFHAAMIRRLHHNSRPGTRQYHLKLMETLSPVPVQSLGSGPGPQTTAIADSANRAEDPEQAFAEEIYIDNAGLVLTSPYLPRLFDMLKLTDGSAFKNRDAAERAVHLLQFMVNGSTDAPEFQLALNKILCGVKTGIPIAREIEISAAEQAALEGLLQGIIANWKAIGKTSLAGLRESFLQREGWLRLKDDAWHLLVEPRAFDMLLDRLPWSFAIIKHPWMERVVHVKWR